MVLYAPAGKENETAKEAVSRWTGKFQLQQLKSRDFSLSAFRMIPAVLVQDVRRTLSVESLERTLVVSSSSPQRLRSSSRAASQIAIRLEWEWFVSLRAIS